ncbi:MAG: hypothetical protein IKO65_00930 [Victivallales bacterium]|nr:hypothetical protein [Victivallales bacterium]
MKPPVECPEETPAIRRRTERPAAASRLSASPAPRDFLRNASNLLCPG